MEKITKIKCIRKLSVWPAYFTVLFNPAVYKSLFRFLGTVLKDFFLLQFSNKLKIRRIPVINVDHPLDDKIPFTPSKVNVYLDFINFWIRPLTMLVKKLGVKKAIPIINRWFDAIEKSYREASRMYKFRMSTMRRPKYLKNFHFIVIHAMDPHLLCVPSLHIAIIVLCFSFYKEVFEMEEFSDEERHDFFRELYEEAVEIGESVLYIKQHSVNCVPAALYMMTGLFPDLFNPIDAVEFINRLFENDNEIPAETKDDIIRHISFMYEQLLLEGCSDDDWRSPIQRWILNYESSSKSL